MEKIIEQRELAGLQYYGLAGITGECLDSIKRLINFGDKINEAKLLTVKEEHLKSHALILNINLGELIAIKSGFASGYKGEGSVGLAIALQILIRHGAEIEEYEVDSSFVERLDRSCLLKSDLTQLEDQSSVRRNKYIDYIYEQFEDVLLRRSGNGFYCNDLLHCEFPASMPFSLLDTRLIDIALEFFDDPDNRILKAFRRLEDIVKKRTDIKDKSGNRLFSDAFLGPESVLHWNDKNGGEHAAKAKLFSDIYGAYRNPRAHGELKSSDKELLNEFLLVNHLYLLEKGAVFRKDFGKE